MSRALPVSIHFVLRFGSTSTSKCAQCGQVSDAYSMIVTGASALPRIRSSGVSFNVAAIWAAEGGVAGACADAGKGPAKARIATAANQVFRIGGVLATR